MRRAVRAMVEAAAALGDKEPNEVEIIWPGLVPPYTELFDWLEGRGPRLYLIQMIDDATSQITAHFVLSDSTEENMRLLWSYVEHHGRPLAFYTDKASHFQTAQKRRRDSPGVDQDPIDMPPTLKLRNFKAH